MTDKTIPPMKKALWIEIAGEGGNGKTHTACTCFPDVCLLDCTPRGDGVNTAMKIFNEDFGAHYHRISDIGQAETIVADIIKNESHKTVVFDEYSGLKKIAAQRYFKLNPTKSAVFPISDWGIINGWIDDMIWNLQDNDINVVTTAGFHDVYVKGEKNGKKASNSPSRADIDIDFRFMLMKVEVEGKPTRIDPVVAKNKFKHISERLKVLPTPLSWESLKEEMEFAKGLEYCE
jgi:hypothetical protein